MKKGLGWPVAMATILAITVGANIWVMRIASARCANSLSTRRRALKFGFAVARRSRAGI